MSSANSPLISGKSSETWTENRMLAGGIPGGRFGGRGEFRPCVESCTSAASAVLEEQIIHGATNEAYNVSLFQMPPQLLYGLSGENNYDTR